MQILLLQTFSTCFGRQAPIIRSIKYWHSSHRYKYLCLQVDPHSAILGMEFPVVVLRTPQRTHYLLIGSDSLPAATAQYQHVAITLGSCQLLKMGTWLPDTCWATCKREIKDNTLATSGWFLSTQTTVTCASLSAPLTQKRPLVSLDFPVTGMTCSLWKRTPNVQYVRKFCPLPHRKHKVLL
jgi:hypothetical protein